MSATGPISTHAALSADVGFWGHSGSPGTSPRQRWRCHVAIITALFRRLSGPRRRDLFWLDRKTLHVRAGQGGTVSSHGAAKGRDRFTRHALDRTSRVGTTFSAVHLFIFAPSLEAHGGQMVALGSVAFSQFETP